MSVDKEIDELLLKGDEYYHQAETAEQSEAGDAEIERLYLLASKEYQGAKEIAENNLGPGHEKTMEIRDSYGAALRGVGNFKDAIEIERETAVRYEKSRGLSNDLAIEARRRLAECFLADTQCSEAINVYQTLLRTVIDAKKDPKIICHIRTDLAAALFESNTDRNISEAVNVNIKNLALAKEALGENHIETVKIRYNLGTELQRLKKYDSALDYFQTNVDIAGKKAWEGSPDSDDMEIFNNSSTSSEICKGKIRRAKERDAKREKEKLEIEQQEQARREWERLEIEKQEKARREREKLEIEKQENARREREKLEIEKQENARREREKLEIEKQEQARHERERLEIEKQEQARREREKLEIERQKLENLDREKRKLEKQELEKQELEKQEMEKREVEKQEQEKCEWKRQEQEKLNKKIQEWERLEQEKTEQRRLEQEKRKEEGIKKQKQEQERRDAERLAELERERITKLEQEGAARLQEENDAKRKQEEEKKLETEKVESSERRSLTGTGANDSAVVEGKNVQKREETGNEPSAGTSELTKSEETILKAQSTGDTIQREDSTPAENLDTFTPTQETQSRSEPMANVLASHSNKEAAKAENQLGKISQDRQQGLGIVGDDEVKKGDQQFNPSGDIPQLIADSSNLGHPSQSGTGRKSEAATMSGSNQQPESSSPGSAVSGSPFSTPYLNFFKSAWPWGSPQKVNDAQQSYVSEAQPQDPPPAQNASNLQGFDTGVKVKSGVDLPVPIIRANISDEQQIIPGEFPPDLDDLATERETRRVRSNENLKPLARSQETERRRRASSMGPRNVSPSSRNIQPRHTQFAPAVEDQADLWFENLDLQAHTFLDKGKGDLYTDKRARTVKIAILDTGIAKRASRGPVPPWVNLYGRRIKAGKMVDKSLPPFDDEDGHGTHAAGLILSVCPYADVYVYRVHRGGVAEGQKEIIKKSNVAAALADAVEKKVDIISMSLGWEEDDDDELESVINRCKMNSILLFAATSNTGSMGRIAYPANADETIAVDSAGVWGDPSKFNPPQGDKQRFAALGEAVKSSFPTHLATEDEEPGYRRMSGTSCATPIAAAIAGLVLEFSRQLPLCLSPSVEKKLKRVEGMRRVLCELFSRPHFHGGSQFNILDPNKLFRTNNIHNEREWYQGIISPRVDAANRIVDCLQFFSRTIGADINDKIQEWKKARGIF